MKLVALHWDLALSWYPKTWNITMPALKKWWVQLYNFLWQIIISYQCPIVYLLILKRDTIQNDPLPASDVETLLSKEFLLLNCGLSCLWVLKTNIWGENFANQKEFLRGLYAAPDICCPFIYFLFLCCYIFK